MTYLAYDVRGIQSFVFAVPRLVYIIGGSALVDRFDRETVRKLAPESDQGPAGAYGAELIFAGGGKGAFALPSEDAGDRLERELVTEAHKIGLDLRIGRNVDYSEAAHCADRLFPYLPPVEQLDTHPCQESGLYPLDPNHKTRSGRRVHSLIAARVFQRGEHLHRRCEDLLLADMRLHPRIAQAAPQAAFLRNVDADGGKESVGSRSLGSRNRWAVIAMDGNGMGLQFAHNSRRELAKEDPKAYRDWVRRRGRDVSDTTEGACRAGIEAVQNAWADDLNDDELGHCIERDESGNALEITLPIRPLIVGGDDIVVLCHPSYAMQFVEATIQSFTSISIDRANAAAREGIELWPATGGALSISAGVLFAPTNLPLATAIPYAETLLRLAKTEGSKRTRPGEPAPPCVDWEGVHEGFIDHPLRRRERSLMFRDGQHGPVVELTRRPYTIEGLRSVRQAADDLFLTGKQRVPGSIAHALLSNLRAESSDRRVFYARLEKNHPNLVAQLREPSSADDGKPSSELGWRRSKAESGDGPEVLSLGLLDAYALAEESWRMDLETAR